MITVIRGRKIETRRRKQTVLPFKRVDYSLEGKDCTVRALSQATPWTYEESHALLKEGGRRDGHGFPFSVWLERVKNKPINGVVFAKAYDWFEWRPQGYDKDMISGPNPNGKSLTLGQFIKMDLPGNYILVVAHHAFAVVDGVIHDSFRSGTRKIVRKVFKVELEEKCATTK